MAEPSQTAETVTPPGGTVRSWIDEWYTTTYPFGARLTIGQRHSLARWIEQHIPQLDRYDLSPNDGSGA